MTNLIVNVKKVDVITMGQFSRFRSGNLYQILCDYLIKLGILDKELILKDNNIKSLVDECLYILNIEIFQLTK